MADMVARRISFFVLLLLGIWAQAANGCTEAHGAPPLAQNAMELTVSAISRNCELVASFHRCECPAMMPNAQSVVSESGKSPLVSCVEGVGAILSPPNPSSVDAAQTNRAFSFLARSTARPFYQFVSRLRQ